MRTESFLVIPNVQIINISPVNSHYKDRFFQLFNFFGFF